MPLLVTSNNKLYLGYGGKYKILPSDGSSPWLAWGWPENFGTIGTSSIDNAGNFSIGTGLNSSIYVPTPKDSGQWYFEVVMGNRGASVLGIEHADMVTQNTSNTGPYTYDGRLSRNNVLDNVGMPAPQPGDIYSFYIDMDRSNMWVMLGNQMYPQHVSTGSDVPSEPIAGSGAIPCIKLDLETPYCLKLNCRSSSVHTFGFVNLGQAPFQNKLF